MSQYNRNTIPDKPPTLPHKRPQDNPGRNYHSDREKQVTHHASGTKHDPTCKGGGKSGKR